MRVCPRLLALAFAIAGLGIAAGVVLVVADGAFLWQAMSAWPAQIASGVGVVLLVSWFEGRRSIDASADVDWPGALALPFEGFAAGAGAAVQVSLFLWGNPLSVTDWASYVLKPLFWLALFGLPVCLLLGVALGVAVGRLCSRRPAKEVRS